MNQPIDIRKKHIEIVKKIIAPDGPTTQYRLRACKNYLIYPGKLDIERLTTHLIKVYKPEEEKYFLRKVNKSKNRLTPCKTRSNKLRI